jgi:hypothetical protein
MGVITVEIAAKLEWRAAQNPATKCWIGVCEAMNLAMEADSLDELHSVIGETLDLVFTDLLEDNELEKYLQERGWQARNLPRGRVAENVKFEVPWQLIAAGATARDSARRAD